MPKESVLAGADKSRRWHVDRYSSRRGLLKNAFRVVAHGRRSKGRLCVHSGQRKIPLRWMYATSFLLLLPAHGRRRLLDARGEVTRRLFLERRNDRRARRVFRGMVAARVEDAPRRRIRRRGNVSLQDDSLLPRVWIGDRNGGKERLRVRHHRLAVKIFGRRQLNDLSEIHDGDAICDVLHHREVVSDEHVGEIVVPLEVLEQVDHLCLHGDIEGRYRLVADDELWFHREGARDPDALTLSA